MRNTVANKFYQSLIIIIFNNRIQRLQIAALSTSHRQPSVLSGVQCSTVRSNRLRTQKPDPDAWKRRRLQCVRETKVRVRVKKGSGEGGWLRDRSLSPYLYGLLAKSVTPTRRVILNTNGGRRSTVIRGCGGVISTFFPS